MQNATRRRKMSENVLGVLEIPEILTILLFTKASVRNTNVCCRRRNAKNKTRVDSLLDTMNNSKEFWGQIRKYSYIGIEH